MDPTGVHHTNRHVDLYITRVPDMGSICKMKMLCSRSRCLQTTPYRISIQNVDWYDPFFLQHGKNRGQRPNSSTKRRPRRHVRVRARRCRAPCRRWTDAAGCRAPAAGRHTAGRRATGAGENRAVRSGEALTGRPPNLPRWSSVTSSIMSSLRHHLVIPRSVPARLLARSLTRSRVHTGARLAYGVDPIDLIDDDNHLAPVVQPEILYSRLG